MQFVVFEKFTSAYLFQIARQKSFDYTSDNFCHASVFYVTNGGSKKSPTLLDENLTCEFKRENSFTLSKSCMKTEQFLFTVKSSLKAGVNPNRSEI